MKLPRIKILALGGTIATRPDASGAMQMGLGAEDLVAAVPALATLAAIDAETVSRVGSHSLGFDQIHAPPFAWPARPGCAPPRVGSA